MSIRLHWFGGWIAALGCLGCNVDLAQVEPIEPGDGALYASYVQPYLEVRCATLDCHGVAGRPLRLFAELGLRREAALREVPVREGLDPTPLTSEELDDNRLAIATLAVDSDEPASTLMLLKPLALDAGGIAHEGGTHWMNRDDPGYRCVRGYLRGDRERDIALACARALDDSTP